MLQTLRNAWKVEELRHKILFTLFIVLLYRIGNAILLCARTRPKFIGGSRAHYVEELL